MKKAIFNFVIVLAAYAASATNSMAFDEIGFALCDVVSSLTGPIGSAIASFAVIFLGIGAFFGKVTWGTALMTATGIFAIFGADTIIPAITGGYGFGCF